MSSPITLRPMASIYLLRGEKILLLYRQGSRVVNNVWIGSAGGHMEPEEIASPEACALREMQEELGLSADEITRPKLRYLTQRMTSGEIRQNYYYFAHLKTDRDLVSTEGTLRWFHLDELKGLPMACTARFMIDHWISVGRSNDLIYSGTADGEKVAFTELYGYE